VASLLGVVHRVAAPSLCSRVSGTGLVIVVDRCSMMLVVCFGCLVTVTQPRSLQASVRSAGLVVWDVVTRVGHCACSSFVCLGAPLRSSTGAMHVVSRQPLVRARGTVFRLAFRIWSPA
jgi:hypothetical protein